MPPVIHRLGLAWFGRVQVPAALVVQFLQFILPYFAVPCVEQFFEECGMTQSELPKDDHINLTKSEHIHKWLYILKMGFMMTTPGHGSTMFYLTVSIPRDVPPQTQKLHPDYRVPQNRFTIVHGGLQYPPQDTTLPPLKCSPETGKKIRYD